MANERKERKRYYYIYKIVFLKGKPANRYYIGKRTFFGTDISADKYAGSGHFCTSYYKKYGKLLGETYTKEILEINDTQTLNTERERYWIGSKYKDDALCMNLVMGGAGCADHEVLCHVQDQYKKDINQYDLDGKFIKTWHGIREAARTLKINRSGIMAAMSGKKPSAFGYMWRPFEGNIDDIPEIQRGGEVAVNQYSLEGKFIARYTSIAEAMKSINYTGAHHDLIGKSCRRKVDHAIAHGYFWRFDGDTVTEEDLKSRILAKEKRQVAIIKAISKPIAQYDKNGNFIAKYASVQEAAMAIKVCPTSISEICAGSNPKRHTAGGYKWKYVDELCLVLMVEDSEPRLEKP